MEFIAAIEAQPCQDRNNRGAPHCEDRVVFEDEATLGAKDHPLWLCW